MIEHWASVDYRLLMTSDQVENDAKLAQPHTVMVFLESLPDKVEELKAELLKVAECSRQEDSCLDYRVQQDLSNPCKFGLYEQWKSKELHLEQFTKPYILEFMPKAEALLAQPYVGVFGEQLF